MVSADAAAPRDDEALHASSVDEALELDQRPATALVSSRVSEGLRLSGDESSLMPSVGEAFPKREVVPLADDADALPAHPADVPTEASTGSLPGASSHPAAAPAATLNQEGPAASVLGASSHEAPTAANDLPSCVPGALHTVGAAANTATTNDLPSHALEASHTAGAAATTASMLLAPDARHDEAEHSASEAHASASTATPAPAATDLGGGIAGVGAVDGGVDGGIGGDGVGDVDGDGFDGAEGDGFGAEPGEDGGKLGGDAGGGTAPEQQTHTDADHAAPAEQQNHTDTDDAAPVADSVFHNDTAVSPPPSNLPFEHTDGVAEDTALPPPEAASSLPGASPNHTGGGGAGRVPDTGGGGGDVSRDSSGVSSAHSTGGGEQHGRNASGCAEHNTDAAAGEEAAAEATVLFPELDGDVCAECGLGWSRGHTCFGCTLGEPRDPGCEPTLSGAGGNGSSPGCSGAGSGAGGEGDEAGQGDNAEEMDMEVEAVASYGDASVPGDTGGGPSQGDTGGVPSAPPSPLHPGESITAPACRSPADTTQSVWPTVIDVDAAIADGARSVPMVISPTSSATGAASKPTSTAAEAGAGSLSLHAAFLASYLSCDAANLSGMQSSSANGLPASALSAACHSSVDGTEGGPDEFSITAGGAGDEKGAVLMGGRADTTGVPTKGGGVAIKGGVIDISGVRRRPADAERGPVKGGAVDTKGGAAEPCRRPVAENRGIAGLRGELVDDGFVVSGPRRRPAVKRLGVNDSWAGTAAGTWVNPFTAQELQSCRGVIAPHR